MCTSKEVRLSSNVLVPSWADNRGSTGVSTTVLHYKHVHTPESPGREDL